jgi:Rod binding domain-containing protein
MKKGVGTTFGKGLGGDIYMSLFDTELSRSLSERGIGLRKIFVRELTRLTEKSGTNNGPALKKPAESTDSI